MDICTAGKCVIAYDCIVFVHLCVVKFIECIYDSEI